MLRLGRYAWLTFSLMVIWSCGGDHGGASESSGGGSSAIEVADFCDARAVLEAKCQRCHQDPPKNGAPFPLETYGDTQAEQTSSGQLVYERMVTALENGIMPPTTGAYSPPVEPLTCAEKNTLLNWLHAGAPRPRGNDPSCADVEPRLVPCTN